MAVYYGVYLILALSLNLEAGFAGQPNFGKVFFFSLGAYASGIVVTNVLSYLGNIPEGIFSPVGINLRTQYARSNPAAAILVFVIACVASVSVGGLFGYLISFPLRRIRSDYLAITLFMTAAISQNFVVSYPNIAGGANGLGGIPGPFVWLNNGEYELAAYAALVLGVALLLYLLLDRTLNSPYGRLLKAIRDDVTAAESFGKVTPSRKTQLFVIASGIAALAGALYTLFINYEAAASFGSTWTVYAWIMIILGGIANNKGALLGAFVLTALDLTSMLVLALMGSSQGLVIIYLRYIIVALLLVVVLLFRPKGIIPEEPLRIRFQKS
jgi:branched-chain amino acid transport system permease protein